MISHNTPEDVGERREARRKARGCHHPCLSCKCPENLLKGADDGQERPEPRADEA
jgi:hypothetical protein